MIEPSWILLFSRKRGRWWVRLLACGRYHHVKAIAYLPAVRTWLFYDVKFNGTRLMLVREDEPDCRAFVQDYLDCCDLVAMPRLPVPRRVGPQPGFWCTLAMKHLVGIRAAALRPDRLWLDSIAVGGKSYAGEIVSAASMGPRNGSQPFESVLTFLKAHAAASSDGINQQSYTDDAAFARQRSEFIEGLRARIRALFGKAATGGRGRRPHASAAARFTA